MFHNHAKKSNLEQISDLVKFVMCALVSRVHKTFYILRKGFTVPGNQGTHDKLNQIFKFYLKIGNEILIFYGHFITI